MSVSLLLLNLPPLKFPMGLYYVYRHVLCIKKPHKCRALLNFLPLFYNCSGDWMAEEFNLKLIAIQYKNLMKEEFCFQN